jgi:hypothetical protein
MKLELKNALDDYQSVKIAGLVGNQTFAQWYPAGPSSYTQAVIKYESAPANNDRAIRNAYGDNAWQYLTDKNNIILKTMATSDQPG